MAKITISYRRDDSMDITGRIFDRLTSRQQASIEDSDVLMVVVGPRWMGGSRHGRPSIHAETDYVRIELEAALQTTHPRHPLVGWRS